jgi:histidinol phosphatase-like enzyme
MKIIIITNQLAVAKEYIAEKELKKIFKKFFLFYRKKILIDDIFYCPFHPSIGNNYYKRNLFLENLILE